MDKKALKLLCKRGELSSEEAAYCIGAGVLTAMEPTAHGTLTASIKEAAGNISLERAAKGFLHSISTGDLRYRTALSSLIWAKALPEHKCERTSEYNGRYVCGICGGEFSCESDLSCEDMREHCRNRLAPQKSFMDICCAGYVYNDLHEFAKLPEVSFCDEDIRIINRIFGLAEEISPANKVNALLKLISAEESLDLTLPDAYSILGVLSSCGFFDTPDCKSCAEGFVPCNKREFVYETDIYYPLNMWRGKHGINYSAAEKIFGRDIAARLTPEKGAVQRKEPRRRKGAAEDRYYDGNDNIIRLDDRQRFYYGLAPLDESWDKTAYYKVNDTVKERTEIWFEGDVIKKLIVESSTESGIYYLESDMNSPTNGRRTVLPKTSRGREQPVTPSLLQTPTYMLGHLMITTGKNSHGVCSYNSSNDQLLPIPYEIIPTKENFFSFSERYIAMCDSSPDYGALLENFRSQKRVTVKFTSGDIFRVQLTPSLYTYGLIICKVRQLEKWEELPRSHPFRSLMTQPIIFRQYAIVTDNRSMTADELENIPLMDMQIAQDNEILWETYPIVCSKKLRESDIDLGFDANTYRRQIIWGLTVHDYDDETEQLIKAHGSDSRTGGVALAINMNCNGYKAGIIPFTPKDTELKKKLAEHFGLDIDRACDSFAEKFGGITRRKFIELAEERFGR